MQLYRFICTSTVVLILVRVIYCTSYSASASRHTTCFLRSRVRTHRVRAPRRERNLCRLCPARLALPFCLSPPLSQPLHHRVCRRRLGLRPRLYHYRYRTRVRSLRATASTLRTASRATPTLTRRWSA